MVTLVPCGQTANSLPDAITDKYCCSAVRTVVHQCTLDQQPWTCLRPDGPLLRGRFVFRGGRGTARGGRGKWHGSHDVRFRHGQWGRGRGLRQHSFSKSGVAGVPAGGSRGCCCSGNLFLRLSQLHLTSLENSTAFITPTKKVARGRGSDGAGVCLSLPPSCFPKKKITEGLLYPLMWVFRRQD